MNFLDLGLALVIVGAAWGGYRLGLAARALSWIGLAGGTVIGVLLVDDVANALRDARPEIRLLGALVFLVTTATVGQTLGTVIGTRLRRLLPPIGGFRTADRLAGATSGVLAALTIVWLLIPALSSTHGWPAQQTRGSAIVRTLDRWGPAPPASLSTLGRLVDRGPFPEVFEDLTKSTSETPPKNGVSAAVRAQVSASIVRIEGRACDQIQQGSGFVATPNLVVTNAHVVAGERSTLVLTPDGRRLGATIVAFDPRRDVAVLHVDRLGLSPLSRADADMDDTGSVFGYPGGGPQHESPSRITDRIVAEGTDIYRTSDTRRDVLVLAAALNPGDSGGPLISDDGHVIGLAFAIDPADDNTAYALTGEEVDAVLDLVVSRGGTGAVDAGPCLVG